MTTPDPWTKPEVRTVDKPGATTSPPPDPEKGEK